MADQVFGGRPRILPSGAVLQQFNCILKVDAISGKSEKLKRFLKVGCEGNICIDFCKMAF